MAGWRHFAWNATRTRRSFAAGFAGDFTFGECPLVNRSSPAAACSRHRELLPRELSPVASEAATLHSVDPGLSKTSWSSACRASKRGSGLRPNQGCATGLPRLKPERRHASAPCLERLGQAPATSSRAGPDGRSGARWRHGDHRSRARSLALARGCSPGRPGHDEPTSNQGSDMLPSASAPSLVTMSRSGPLDFGRQPARFDAEGHIRRSSSLGSLDICVQGTPKLVFGEVSDGAMQRAGQPPPPPSELSVVSSIGETLASLRGSQWNWTLADVAPKLLAEAPLPKGQFYRLDCGSRRLAGARTLRDCRPLTWSHGPLELKASVLKRKEYPEVQRVLSTLEACMEDARLKDLVALSRPSKAVLLVLETLCRLLCIPPKAPAGEAVRTGECLTEAKRQLGDIDGEGYFAASKKTFLRSKRSFVDALSGFDLDQCDAQATEALLLNFVAAGGAWFRPALLGASPALELTCHWFHAISNSLREAPPQ